MSKDLVTGIYRQFAYYKQLGDRTFDQLTDGELLKEPVSGTNSIAIIVKHLWGNMLSRWTDFLSSDGEKSWRNRDAEFENDISGRDELISKWEEGWRCLFEAITPLKEEDLHSIVHIRNEEHTVEEALLRQLAHYAYHVGQIVQLGKWIKGDDWQSLSIPKGGSDAYNKMKFSSPKVDRPSDSSEEK